MEPVRDVVGRENVVVNRVYLIIDVWGGSDIAFVPESEFKEFFIVEDNRYAVLNEKKFGTPYNSSDTYMQGCIVDHGRSCYSTGDLEDILIANVYIWRSMKVGSL